MSSNVFWFIIGFCAGGVGIVIGMALSVVAISKQAGRRL